MVVEGMEVLGSNVSNLHVVGPGHDVHWALKLIANLYIIMITASYITMVKFQYYLCSYTSQVHLLVYS